MTVPKRLQKPLYFLFAYLVLIVATPCVVIAAIIDAPLNMVRVMIELVGTTHEIASKKWPNATP